MLRGGGRLGYTPNFPIKINKIKIKLIFCLPEKGRLGAINLVLRPRPYIYFFSKGFDMTNKAYFRGFGKKYFDVIFLYIVMVFKCHLGDEVSNWKN